MPHVLPGQVVVRQDHVLDCRGEVPEHFGPDRTLKGGGAGGILPDEAGMVRVGGDPQIGPPSPDLLAEHHIHQLRVVVVPLQGGG